MTTTRDIRELTAWQDRAACALVEPAAFFPGPTRDDDLARQVCRRCPVRQPCLDYALEHDERFGIWGGLDERERTRLRNLRR